MIPKAFKIVDEFEKAIAEYAGSKYAVSVESGTAAIFLSLMYRKSQSTIWSKELTPVHMPKFTYPSVASSVIHSGLSIVFEDSQWEGEYELQPYKIWDSALRFKKGMYHGGLQCLSFHAKKHLPIGRGGMILTDDENAYKWLLKARFDGRTQGIPLNEDEIDVLGWNMYLEPAQAAKGLQIFEMIKDKDLPDLDSTKQNYPDLSKLKIYAI